MLFLAQVVLNAGALPSLLHLLSQRSEKVRKQTCFVVSNIMAGTTDQLQVCSTLFCVCPPGVAADSAIPIVSATHPGLSILQAVMDTGIVSPLAECVASDELSVRKEACWALTNGISAGTDEQVRYIYLFQA